MFEFEAEGVVDTKAWGQEMALCVLVMGCLGWPFIKHVLALPLDAYISFPLGPLPGVFLSQATSILTTATPTSYPLAPESSVARPWPVG